MMAPVKASTMNSVIFFALQFILPATCRMNYLISSDLQCHNVTRMGIGKQCCDGSLSPTTWGQACNGDLVGNTPGGACEANEILGNSAFQNSPGPVDTGGICYSPGQCHIQNWSYLFPCCACPSNYKVLTYGYSQGKPNCYTGAQCVGCTEPNEVLVGQDDSNGYTCVVQTVTSTSTLKSSTATSTSKLATTTATTTKTTLTTTTKPLSTSAKTSWTAKTSTTTKK